IRGARERLLDLRKLGSAADERRVQPSPSPDRSGHEPDEPEGVAVERLELGRACDECARRCPDEDVAARCRPPRALGLRYPARAESSSDWSWHRIACCSWWSSGPGSIPSSSTRVSLARLYASRASA